MMANEASFVLIGQVKALIVDKSDEVFKIVGSSQDASEIAVRIRDINNIRNLKWTWKTFGFKVTALQDNKMTA